MKGISKEELEARNDLVHSLKDRIEAIPDGSSTATKQSTAGWATSTSYTGIKFDSSSGNNNLFVGIFYFQDINIIKRCECSGIGLNQMRDSQVSTFNKLKSLTVSGKNMKCAE